ncbi:MAG: SDR family NAD(P)-dependent oxidoreductase [Acidimicrobiia bacterium]
MTLDPASVALNGRVAVVTGAAVGIGRATALALARFGADLAVCDRDVDNLDFLVHEIEGLGHQVVAAGLDVRDADGVAGFLETVRDRFGRVDVLVNNAGGGFRAGFLDVSEKGQRSLVDENFTSVTHLVRGVVPLMPAEGGSIVTVTSIEAHRAGPEFAVYSAMKAACTSLTKSLALEFGPRLIRVNCVAPDVIPTPGIGAEMGVHTPLPRAGHVDDIAGAVLFLASNALSGFVTGTTIHVDGGNLAAGGWRRQDDGSYTT